MRVDDLDARRSRIRLPKKELAYRSGLDMASVWRAFDKRVSPNLRSVEAIERALEAEEKALLAHLMALHPNEVVA